MWDMLGRTELSATHDKYENQRTVILKAVATLTYAILCGLPWPEITVHGPSYPKRYFSVGPQNPSNGTNA